MKLDKSEKVLVLGSCFAANIGQKLRTEGWDVCLNPFGTLFNPASIASSIRRLDNAQTFTVEDCVHLGAGAQLWGSFSHYTRHARPLQEDFLKDANDALLRDSVFFSECSTVIVTFGTSFVFRNEKFAENASQQELPEHLRGIVSNCLKLPAKEFTRFRLSVDEICELWRPLLDGPLKDKRILFTVSPIRHLADTAHGNQLSKATLLLAIDKLISEYSGRDCELAYFPSYEIVLDELRDYSWYAEDKVHPSDEAIEFIWKRFRESCL